MHGQKDKLVGRVSRAFSKCHFPHLNGGLEQFSLRLFPPPLFTKRTLSTFPEARRIAERSLGGGAAWDHQPGSDDGGDLDPFWCRHGTPPHGSEDPSGLHHLWRPGSSFRLHPRPVRRDWTDRLRRFLQRPERLGDPDLRISVGTPGVLEPLPRKG